MQTLREWFDPDIVWHAPGHSQLAGDHQGVDAVLGFFGQTMELTGGSFRVEVHDAVAHDEHAVGLHTAHAERAGEDAGGQQHGGLPRSRREGHRGLAGLG
jgi:uncharacterized protein